MSFLKLSGGACLILVAFAMLATCQSALADTTTLICDSHSRAQASPETIDLNEAAGSVTIHHMSLHNPGGNPDPIPGGTDGPFTAKFTTDTITFSAEEPGHGHDTYTINRLTGIVDWVTPAWSVEFTCQVGKAQF
jgi:hypothetical protein